jgi:hypothetical protein
LTGNRPNSLAALKTPRNSELAGFSGLRMVTLEVADSTSRDFLILGFLCGNLMKVKTQIFKYGKDCPNIPKTIEHANNKDSGTPKAFNMTPGLCS